MKINIIIIIIIINLDLVPGVVRKSDSKLSKLVYKMSCSRVLDSPDGEPLAGGTVAE